MQSRALFNETHGILELKSIITLICKLALKNVEFVCNSGFTLNLASIFIVSGRHLQKITARNKCFHYMIRKTLPQVVRGCGGWDTAQQPNS